jgi:AraC-like DNA-binding protein
MNADAPADRIEGDLDAAVMVWGNHYEFTRGRRPFTNPVTFSYMLFWCLAGRGWLTHNGSRQEVGPGSVVMVPWAHVVRYEADPDDPMIGGAVHLLPWHDSAAPIQRRVGFGADDPLARLPERSGPPWHGFEGVVRSRRYADWLLQLGEAALASMDENVTDGMLRAYGVLIAHTYAAAVHEQQPVSGPSPALAAMQEHIRIFYAQPMTTPDIAVAGGCAVTTAQKLFREHAGKTPQEWLRDVRLGHATRLLRTTNLRISEIANRVGFRDSLYFSRVFKTVLGVAPRDYDRRNLLY